MIKEIVEEIRKNPLLRDIEINEKNYIKLYQYHQQIQNCKKCNGLANCQNSNKGYKPVLLENGKIGFCMCDELKKNNRSNVKGIFLSNQALDAMLEEFDTNTVERKKILAWASGFVANFGKNTNKGLYLHGPFSSGKTYLLSAIANKLSEKNIKTILAFFPDLSRELKSSINSNTLEQRVYELKTVPCLMFDDFGGEMASAWLRDEIVGPVLQYRLTEGLPTFISSNLDYQQLIDHLSISRDASRDDMKAQRIVERIKKMTTLVRMNERYNK